MRIGSLFSGAGMLDVAAMQVFPGSSVAWHCEIDPAAGRVLAHHWPDVPNLGDVGAIDWAAVEPVDIVTGGFPCQDVSAAGRRAGLGEGTRSGQWSHMRAAVETQRPRWVLIENVQGLLSARAIRQLESDQDALGDGNSRAVLRAIGAVLGDLADIGYDAQWTRVRASDVGACHHRARIFILAHPADTTSSGRESVDGRPGGQAARSRRERLARGGTRRDAAADAAGEGPQGTCESAWPDAAGQDADGGRRHPAGRDSEAVALLPTPSVADGTGGHRSRSGDRIGELLLPGIATAYAESALLPTPRATDGTKGGPGQRGSSGDLMLPSLVMTMLPTPEAKLAHSGPDYARMSREGSGGHDLTTAVAPSERWGEYGAAVRRQERLSGRPAPSPTEPNRAGKPRLSAAFAEWMMFWPDKWATDPEFGIGRSDQLRIIGNGVIPRQAVAAFRYLLDVAEVVA